MIAVFAVAGLGSGLINPLIDTVQLERIPAEIRGRTQSLITAAAWIGIPAGGITGAALIAAVIYPGCRVTWQAATRKESATNARPATDTNL